MAKWRRLFPARVKRTRLFFRGSTYEDNSSSLPDRTLSSALRDQPSETVVKQLYPIHYI